MASRNPRWVSHPRSAGSRVRLGIRMDRPVRATVGSHPVVVGHGHACLVPVGGSAAHAEDDGVAPVCGSAWRRGQREFDHLGVQQLRGLPDLRRSRLPVGEAVPERAAELVEQAEVSVPAEQPGVPAVSDQDDDGDNDEQARRSGPGVHREHAEQGHRRGEQGEHRSPGDIGAQRREWELAGSDRDGSNDGAQFEQVDGEHRGQRGDYGAQPEIRSRPDQALHADRDRGFGRGERQVEAELERGRPIVYEHRHRTAGDPRQHQPDRRAEEQPEDQRTVAQRVRPRLFVDLHVQQN